MSFKDRNWHKRFDALGDQAESVFEEVMRTKLKRGFWKTGLERPPLKVADLPMRERHRPDYLTSRCYVEVQGFGNDQTLKLKVEKLDALAWWHTVHPVELFAWDSKLKRYCFIPLEALRAQRDLVEGVTLGWFPEGKAYFAYSPDAFVGWVSFTPQPKVDLVEEAAA